MSPLRRGGLFVSAALFAAACSGAGQTSAPPSARLATPPSTTLTTAEATAAAGTTAPATSAAASVQPTAGATGGPSASLDATRSDAGVAARVTLANDTRGGRDGTYDIYGLAEDGSECSGAFEDDYLVVAWVDDAPDGQLRRFGVSVGKDDIPHHDATTSDITDGGVSFDFASPTGIGTQYTGNATQEDQGSSTIDVTRSGSTLVFDFEGVTFAGATFSGQLICTDV